jgi:cytochrome c oxidase subunit 2
VQLSNIHLLSADCPYPLQTGFQDPATVYMESLIEFNYHLLFIIVTIVILVGWQMLQILLTFSEKKSTKILNFYHSSTLEIVWTTIPALVLLSLLIPSFSLLYGLDENEAPEISVKIYGHQWYWRYELSDLNSCLKIPDLKFSAYILSDEYLKMENAGFKRLLETNRRLVLPTSIPIRLLITGADVLHSWTIPSFGVKVDACPGRLNQAHLFIKRAGLFFGQCSEICGSNHGFMPIAVMSMPIAQFNWVLANQIIKIKMALPEGGHFGGFISTEIPFMDVCVPPSVDFVSSESIESLPSLFVVPDEADADTVCKDCQPDTPLDTGVSTPAVVLPLSVKESEQSSNDCKPGDTCYNDTVPVEVVAGTGLNPEVSSIEETSGLSTASEGSPFEAEKANSNSNDGPGSKAWDDACESIIAKYVEFLYVLCDQQNPIFGPEDTPTPEECGFLKKQIRSLLSLIHI